MPIYEYACRDCGQRFEQRVRAGSAPTCPHCQSTQLDKQLSVFGTASARAAPANAAGPCGRCGHPDGPGSCALN
ncbi:MAG: zinc ribbon domain-containing protein [Burkholderiaceae bacterium]|jgi:putative FmdB family regulatory protein|nr:zinc ribbon domain-containing protein [Burkholderiaceae bacterium]